MLDRRTHYLTRAKHNALLREIDYMQGEGRSLLADLLGSSPGSGMGRPNDLPVHQMAGEFMGHLQDIKSIVDNAVIIDDLRDSVPESSGISVGWTVTVRYNGEDELETYTILGRHEVDVAEGKISCWSPIGSALIGKRKGDSAALRLESSGRQVRISIEEATKLSLDFDYSRTNWRERLERAKALDSAQRASGV